MLVRWVGTLVLPAVVWAACNGVCMNVNNQCAGEFLTGKCAGDNRIQCCTGPAATCDSGGVCQDVSITCAGGYRSGTSGCAAYPANVQCCLPSSIPDPPDPPNPNPPPVTPPAGPLHCSPDDTAGNEGNQNTLYCYPDTLGLKTLAYGFNIDPRAWPGPRKVAELQAILSAYPSLKCTVQQLWDDCGPAYTPHDCTISNADALALFRAVEHPTATERVCRLFDSGIQRWPHVFYAFADISMGADPLRKFRKLRKAVAKRNWNAAANEVINSLWCRQVGPTRCGKAAACVRYGAAFDDAQALAPVTYCSGPPAPAVPTGPTSALVCGDYCVDDGTNNSGGGGSASSAGAVALTPSTVPVRAVVEKFLADTPGRAEYQRVAIALAVQRGNWDVPVVAPYDTPTVAAAVLTFWAYEVAWHESQLRNIAQTGGGPGRGYFQYELTPAGSSKAGSNQLAVTHAINWMSKHYAAGGGVPQWLDAMDGENVDFTTLTFNQQLILFLLDKSEGKGANLKAVAAAANDWSTHDTAFYDAWKKGHKKVPPYDPWRGGQFTVNSPLPPANA